MRYLLLITTFFIVPLFAGELVTKQNDHMYNARYGEIFMVTGGPLHFKGAIYNTIGLNQCPEDLWERLNPEQLKKDFHVEKVLLNGPRYFLMDQTSLLYSGKINSFQGLQARLLATIDIPLKNLLRGGSRPYIENSVARTTRYLFKKGRTIYELTSPSGKKYVMQSYSQIIDPNLKVSDLKNLRSRLHLPLGWSYESRKLTHDYLVCSFGVAHVIQDDFKNSYQRE